MSLLKILLLLMFFVGCASSDNVSNSGATETTDTSQDVSPTPTCSNGTCELGEDCWTCPEDCECRCGDGVCTHGEYCVVCPKDCDCDSLAATPPMGWNSWNRFGCDISESLIREIAQALVSSGMRDVGYTYLNLDDCWQVSRNENGEIEADPIRFPSGIPALADYVHSLGLKFGIYTCAGTMTCQQRPGSLGFEAKDMSTYAKWGVDYVKVDWCFTEGLDAPTQYAKFRDGIAASGRNMVLSICNWGRQSPWIWGPSMGQLWRTSGDISDSFYIMMLNFDVAASLPQYAGPGHFNDPDMLEVGNGGMTEAEYRAHMGLWAALAAPLIAGNDIRNMDESTRELLTNPEVIAIDQDPFAIQAVRVTEGIPELYYRPLAEWGGRAFVVFNRSFEDVTTFVSWEQLGLASGTALVRDPWARKDLGLFNSGIEVTVPSHEAVLLHVRGSEIIPPEGTSYLSDLPFAYAANSNGQPVRDSVGTLASDGQGMKIRGISYNKGLGVHGGSVMLFALGGKCKQFNAVVGVDDAASGKGSVTFEVWTDNHRAFASQTLTGLSEALYVDIDLTSARYIRLVTTPAYDNEHYDFADWADAKVVCD